MEAAGAPTVNADDTGECSSRPSSDEEDEPWMDVLRRLEHGRKRKKHARVQVTVPTGTQPNVERINTFCSKEKPPWGHIKHTEVPPLPHTATNRFKITDDLSNAYANIAARANDLGSKVMLLRLVTETLERQGAAILAPHPSSDGRRVLVLNKHTKGIASLLAKGYTKMTDASAMYILDVDDTETGAIPDADEPPEVQIPRMREHFPSLDDGGDARTSWFRCGKTGTLLGASRFPCCACGPRPPGNMLGPSCCW